MRDYATQTSSIHAPAGEVPKISLDIYSKHLVLSAEIAGARVIWFMRPDEDRAQSIGDLVASVTASLSTIKVETIND